MTTRMMQGSQGLVTDLYQLTMAAAYFDNGMRDQRAVFEMFVRKLPAKRSYLLAAGLEQALAYLETLRFSEEEIGYLRAHPAFKNVSREFYDFLGGLRFTGDVWAMREGTPLFANEPILRVEAPIIEAQIVETFLLSTINFQTMIASKAARLVHSAKGREVIEFGTRRAHGPEAGLLAARAAYLAGCVGTSNVEAGHRFGIPTIGTLAHSFVMSFDDEGEAFRAFLNVFPGAATILVDTFDTLEAVKLLSREFPGKVPAVRLDSGDLLSLSIQSRQILDAAGMNDTKIVVSNDLNEYRIADLLANGARIDAFGVGTQLATSFDYPALSGVYKLVGLSQNGKVKLKMKLSPEKATYPGAKQVWRRIDKNDGIAGRYIEDVIALDDEPEPADGEWQSLLTPVMKNGKVLGEAVLSLEQARKRAQKEMARLPEELLALDPRMAYAVRVSERLEAEKSRLQAGLIAG